MGNHWCIRLRETPRQTLWGLIGGLLFWTGWVEFLFLYYARRYGVPPEIENGQVVTKPEYLIMPASFGMWMMVMTMYIFSTKNGCDFITWIQKKCFGKRKQQIAFQPMTRHTSIVTFMELNMMLWALYLLLMFCYDKNFLGDHHPWLISLVSAALSDHYSCSNASFSWLLGVQTSVWRLLQWLSFWTPVEILGRINFFHEFWVEPEKYTFLMVCILIAFIFLLLYFWFKASKRRKFRSQ